MKLQIRDSRKGDWYWVSRTIYEKYTSKIGVIGLALYNAYASHSYDSQKVFPSQNRIAKKLNITKPTLIKYNKLLVAYKLIKISKKTGKVNTITLLKVRALPVNVVNTGGKGGLLVGVKEVYPNNKHIKKNNKKRTVADKSDDGMRTSLPLEDIKKSFEYKCSSRLAKKVIEKRKVCQKINLKNWATSIRKFLSHGIIKKREFKEVLKWYIGHFGERYMVEAFSVETFCKRFIDIQTAMEKSRLKDLTDTDEYIPPKVRKVKKKRKG